jgi:hypothetical protein
VRPTFLVCLSGLLLTGCAAELAAPGVSVPGALESQKLAAPPAKRGALVTAREIERGFGQTLDVPSPGKGKSR